eukprot:5642367-Pleurochrysis_carterae.AAC.1
MGSRWRCDKALPLSSRNGRSSGIGPYLTFNVITAAMSIHLQDASRFICEFLHCRFLTLLSPLLSRLEVQACTWSYDTSGGSIGLVGHRKVESTYSECPP